MKLKYQQGGTFVPPFAVMQPFILPTEQPTKASSTTKKSKEEDDKGMDVKDIIELFKGIKGLEGDVMAASSMMTSLFNSIDRKMNSPQAKMFGGTSSIASDYIKILNLSNQMQNQKELYERAEKTAVDKGSIREAVINSRGLVMVTDGEGFDWVTPEEYAQNIKEYDIVTNQELLNYRFKGIGGLAFNSDVLLTISNSVGINEVTDYIQNTLKDLGTNTTEDSGYAGMKKGELMQGLKDYATAISKSGMYNSSIQDLYKADIITKTQAEQANLALQYIYTSMSDTAKSLLKLKSDGTTTGAVKYVLGLINSKLSYENTFDPQLVGGPTKDSIDSNKNESSIERTFVMEVQAGRGAHVDEFVLNNESNNAIKTDMDVYGGVVKLDGNYSDKSSVVKMLKDSGLISIMLGEVGYFGNQKVTLNQMEDLLYDGGSFARIELPVNSNNSPRFDLLEKMDQFEKRVKLLDEDPVKLLQNEEFKDLRIYFDKEGNKRTSLFKPFLIFNTITSAGLLDIDEKNSFVTDKESDAYAYDDIKYYLSKDSSNPDRYLDLDDLDWGELFTFGQYDHIYKGTLYIPIGMNKEAAAIGSKQTVKNDNLELEYQLSQKDYNTIDIANLNN